MMWNGYGMHGLGGLGMLLFWALVIAGIVYLVRWYGPTINNSRVSGGDGNDNAVSIARERLARGEISPEEYESIKRALER
jgi:putative membrane protein